MRTRPRFSSRKFKREATNPMKSSPNTSWTLWGSQAGGPGGELVLEGNLKWEITEKKVLSQATAKLRW